MPIQRHRDGLTGPVHFCAAVKAADQSRFSGTLCARDLEAVIVLPFSPGLFLETSVEGAEGGDWPRRFQKLWDETPPARRYNLGLPRSDDAYAICNERVLELARREGAVQLIALWDGGGGDGPGGTADLVERAKKQSGREPDIIDPKDLLRQQRGSRG